MRTERWHGTPGGYSNHGCRCDGCTAAWRRWRRERGYNRNWWRRRHDVGPEDYRRSSVSGEVEW